LDPFPLDLSAWPSVLAFSLQDYQREQQPILKLWLMCDVVELTLRLAAVVGLGELRASHNELPADLRAVLAGQIYMPTAGQWKGIVQQILQHLPQQSPITQDLTALFESIANLLDAPAEQTRSVENSLSTLRNEGLAHGAGVRKELAKKWLDNWQPRFEVAMAQQAKILTTWLLVCSTPEGLAALRGPSQRPHPICPPVGIAKEARAELAAAENDAVVLVRGSIVRRLWPLTLFGKPRSGMGNEEDFDAEPAPQLYSRNEVTLQYTPIGSEKLWRSVGSTSAAEAFLRLFTPPPIKREVGGFEQDLRNDAAALVGRREEVQRIQQLVAERRQGVLWMTGRPGIGKSFLMAKAAVDPLPEPASADARSQYEAAMSKMLVLAFRFKTGDDRCSRDRFCQFALERLREWPGLQPPTDPKEDTKEAHQRKALSLQLREVLGRVNAADSWRVLILLDGLDELLEQEQPKHRQDPQSVALFVRELPASCRELPSVLWLCASRLEAALERAFTDDVCIPVFPVDAADADRNGVPPMDAADIRKMLLTVLEEPARRRLLDKDCESSDGQQIINDFVAKVAAYSQGLPLYVRFVIGEVKARGTLRHFDPTDLPKSLDKFYARLIQRSTVGVLQQITTPLVATLAVAKEPLSREALLTLLRDRKILDPSPGEDQAARQFENVTQALAIVAPLLRVASTPDDKLGYAMTHHTLREFITDPHRCQDMHEPVTTARRALLDSCANVALLDSPAHMYLVRNAVSHLIEGERWDDLERLLTDIFFLDAKNKAGLVFELATDITAAVAALPVDRPPRRVLRLLEEALRRDIHFIHHHRRDYPQGLFQCLWNSCWWHDCSEATRHYDSADNAWPQDGPSWDRVGFTLSTLLESWRHTKEKLTPGFNWLRSLRPPRVALGGPQIAVFRSDESFLKSVAYSPDGKRIACGTPRDVLIWEAGSGKQLSRVGGHHGIYDTVDAVAFSPDGQKLAAGSYKTVRVWDTNTHLLVARLQGHELEVSSVAFSPDGLHIVSGSWDRSVRIWDVSRGQLLASLLGHDGFVWSVAYSPDGLHVASASGDTTVRVWSTTDWREVACLRGHDADVTCVAFSPGGKWLLSGSKDESIRVWDAKQLTEIRRLQSHDDRLTSLCYSPDGRRFFSTGTRIGIWDAQSGRHTRWLHGHEHWVTSVAHSPNSLHLATAHMDGTVRVWDLENKRELPRLRNPDTTINSVVFSPDHKWLVTGSGQFFAKSSAGAKIHVWNARTGELFTSFLERADQVLAAIISPDSQRILSWGVERNLLLWKLNSGRPLACLFGHEDWVECAAFSPNGQKAVSGSRDGTVRVWDAFTGHPLICIQGQKTVNSVAFSPDDRWVVSAASGWEGVLVYDADNGVQRATFRGGHEGTVNSAVFSVDGRQVASAGDDKRVMLWRADGGVPVKWSDDYVGQVARLAYSVDGRKLICFDGCDTMWLRDSRTLEILEVIHGTADVDAIAFGRIVFPFQAFAANFAETVIRCAETTERIAVFSARPYPIQTHPGGRTWGGIAGNHLYLFSLEAEGACKMP
jgi:WD40 repeat protein